MATTGESPIIKFRCSPYIAGVLGAAADFEAVTQSDFVRRALVRELRESGYLERSVFAVTRGEMLAAEVEAADDAADYPGAAATVEVFPSEGGTNRHPISQGPAYRSEGGVFTFALDTTDWDAGAYSVYLCLADPNGGCLRALVARAVVTEPGAA
jgi:hypothetical protein